MTLMPIASTILAGKPIVPLGDMLVQSTETGTIKNPRNGRAAHTYDLQDTAVVYPVDDKTHASIFRSVSRATPFNIQVASELYWGGKKAFYRLDRDFGRMRPPYDEVWLEWRMPKSFIDNDGQPQQLGEATYNTSAYFAARITYIDVDEFKREDPSTSFRPGAAGGIAMNVMSTSSTPGQDELGLIYLNECALAFAIDDDGLYVDESLTCNSSRMAHHSKDIQQVLQNECLSNLFVACMALNLVNCRNVQTRPAGTIHQKRSGSDKRRGLKEPIRFHTIVLPGMTVERKNSTARERRNNADVMALHMVRGHFKTYTKDAPLLGRHTGTYWWNPAVRGNKNNGQIVSDYQIGAS